MSNYPFDDPDIGYDDYDDEPRECDHSEYESDIITGRAHCAMCPHSWYLSSEDIAAEHERIARYQEWEDRERRWERWRQVRDWFRSLIPRRRKPAMSLDDEIPF